MQRLLRSWAFLLCAVFLMLPLWKAVPAAADDMPRLTLSIETNTPGGAAEFSLFADNCDSLEGFGLVIQLPAVLSPVCAEDNAVIFDSYAPESALVASNYYAKTGFLSYVYVDYPSEALPSLLAVFPLRISRDAVPGQNYPITAQVDSFSGTSELTVTETLDFSPIEASQRELSETECTLTDSSSHTLTLTPEPPEDSCVWCSSAPEIVSVDESGNLTPRKNGIAEITAVCEGQTFACAVIVALTPWMNYAEYALSEPGETVLLTVYGVAEGETILWESSSPEIAMVDEHGQVTCKSEGEAVITAAWGDNSLSCRILCGSYARGDVNHSGRIDIEDATMALACYTAENLGLPATLDTLEQQAADVDFDGIITIDDAQMILVYYTVQDVTGNAPSWDVLAVNS